jgi:hypothetical protein
MTNTNRTRYLLAAQKVRLKTDPQPTPEAPKLTAEQRREIYAPKPANTAPQQLQGSEWVTAWRMISRATYGLTAFSAVLFGGIIAGESKKGIKG